MRTPLILLVLLLTTIRVGAGQNAAVPLGWGSSLPATCVTGDVFTISSAGPKVYQCTATNTWTQVGGSLLHVISFSLDGSGAVITTGSVGVFPTANFSCTINKAQISADQSGSITIDVWKAAGAIPTSANKISGSAPVTLASAQFNQASSLTGWTTAVAVGDVFGFSVQTAATVTKVTGQIWCQ